MPPSERTGSALQRYSPRPLTDGERWTAEALATLRRRHYRPGAWAAFVSSALERSAADRRARPLMVRQARVWCVSGAGAWVTVCAIARGGAGCPLRGLVWWLTVWRMLEWHLGMAEGGDGRPRDRLSPADAITLARFWLVPAARATASSTYAFPAVIVIGGLTDWLDGYVARRRGRTRLGRDLDTTADLAFLTAVTFAAHAAGRMTRLAFAVLTARHAVGLTLALGAVFARARRSAIRARPWGAALRISGLAIGAAGGRRCGTVLAVAGSVVPPHSTAAHLSRV